MLPNVVKRHPILMSAIFAATFLLLESYAFLLLAMTDRCLLSTLDIPLLEMVKTFQLACTFKFHLYYVVLMIVGADKHLKVFPLFLVFGIQKAKN